MLSNIKNPAKSPFKKGGLRGFDIPEKTNKIINSFVVDYKFKTFILQNSSPVMGFV